MHILSYSAVVHLIGYITVYYGKQSPVQLSRESRLTDHSPYIASIVR